MNERPDPTEPETDAHGATVDDDASATTVIDDRIGQLVDNRYTILEAMASGSMGAVYKAERMPVGKLVALKFLHASFSKDSEFTLRFERETRVMSKLAHPNCVSVVDFGVWEGEPYLAMEYVAGTTLRQILDKGPLPVGRALVLARQIAAGLAHAHSHDVVHRDVKPANIMISNEVGTGDHVRILDFGLARLRGNVGRDATQLNVVVGTPNYMAPEQTIGGGTIDARTDIYAVGVVLFEMIAGERPFTAKDTMALLGMHRAAPTPKLVDRMNMMGAADIPDGVQALIDKAMAKSPDDRFQTAVELADAIASLVDARRPSSPEPLYEIVSQRTAADSTAAAPTLVDVDSGKVATSARAKAHTEPTGIPHRGMRHPLALLAILVAVLAGTAYFLLFRTGDRGKATTANGKVTAAADAAMLQVDAAQIAVVPADAAEVAIALLDAPEVQPDAEELPEIEMDPLIADNPDPDADKNDAEDEDPNAPDKVDDEEVEPPPTPTRAKTVNEAVQMLKEGKRELALTSLHALGKNSPKNSYIPFLLGNIYNDKLWWSVAIDHYAKAIAKNGAYRKNAVLNKNVIRMLASRKTVRKAAGFIKKTIGHSARPYLASAAKSDKNGTVRKQAALLLKQIR